MSKHVKLLKLPSWLGARSGGRVRPQEPADLGTAFGMECWLDESQPMPVLPGDPAKRSHAGGRAPWLKGWLPNSRRG